MVKFDENECMILVEEQVDAGAVPV
jgi:hypothetical protein